VNANNRKFMYFPEEEKERISDEERRSLSVSSEEEIEEKAVVTAELPESPVTISKCLAKTTMVYPKQVKSSIFSQF
jgi:hypothetical protein